MELTEKQDGKAPNSLPKKKYLVAENWCHCFVGSKESTVRWLLEIGVGVIAGQVLNGNRWEDMHRDEIADMQGELDDNMIVDVWSTDFGDEIVMVTEIPEWARDGSTGVRTSGVQGAQA